MDTEDSIVSVESDPSFDPPDTSRGRPASGGEAAYAGPSPPSTADEFKAKARAAVEAEMAAKEESLLAKREKNSERRIRHFKKKFDEFDVAGAGSIDKETINEIFLQLGMKFDKYEVNKMFQKFDEDGSGTFEFHEFCALITALNKKRYQTVFGEYDIDGSGELDQDEVGAAFSALGYEFSKEQVTRMVLEYDFSGDGTIQIDEFCEMLEGTLIVEEEEVSSIEVDESPWGIRWGIEVETTYVEDEATGKLGWIVRTDESWEEPDDAEQDPDLRGIPALRPTVFLRSDGNRYKGPNGGLVVARGWQTKMVPARTVHWGYPEEETWQMAGGGFTGNGVPMLPTVNISATDASGQPVRKHLIIPDASLSCQPLGDPPGEEVESEIVRSPMDFLRVSSDPPDIKPLPRGQSSKTPDGSSSRSGVLRVISPAVGEDIQGARGEMGRSRVESFGAVVEGGEEMMPHGDAEDKEDGEIPVFVDGEGKAASEGEYASASEEGDRMEQEGVEAANGAVDDGGEATGNVEQDRTLLKDTTQTTSSRQVMIQGGQQESAHSPERGDSMPRGSTRDLARGRNRTDEQGGAPDAGQAAVYGAQLAGEGMGASRRSLLGRKASQASLSSPKAARASFDTKPRGSSRSLGGGAGTPGSSTRLLPSRGSGSSKSMRSSKKEEEEKIDDRDGGIRKSLKYVKMKERAADLALKKQNLGLKLMEDREYALLLRQVAKMDAAADERIEKAKAQAAEEAAWRPQGSVTWTLKVGELDEGGLGMRLGVVHVSVPPGQDWNDYTGCNNKSFWWSNYSGALFVGDVLVPESGSCQSMSIIDQWAPSRTKPRMGIPWGKGDVLTVHLDLGKAEVSFRKNGVPTSHKLCGVWGEVMVGVQMACKGDSVMMLEGEEEKKLRIDARIEDVRQEMEEERKQREERRKEALSKLGLL